MQRHLTVGSLIGVPLGTTPSRPATAAPAGEVAASKPDTEVEGPGWSISAGVLGHDHQPAWRGDGIEALTYNNPFGQVMERVWFDGKICFAVDLGKVDVDASRVKVAQEYIPVYAAELGPDGKASRPPEGVPGQLNIYDTVPGMERYSPIWQFNYVVVPRDYEINSLKSEGDCLASGYPILKSNDFEN